MRLVDTSTWIEVLSGSDFGLALTSELPARSDWLVPTVVQLELAKWLTREFDEEKAGQVIAFTQTCTVVALDTALALEAAMFATLHKLATADAIIYATAEAFGAELLTCDRHFAALPGVRYIAKA